jgi:hypothetical protein
MNLTYNSSEQPSTLAESLDVLLPNLMPTLVKPDRLSNLKALAANLAPILRGGFECRLSAIAPQVDLQQCIVRDENELSILRESIAHQIPGNPGWSNLQDFLTEGFTLNSAIAEIWLEFDVDPTSDPTSVTLPLPAIFVSLPHHVSPALQTYEIAATSLNLLLGNRWYDWQENLDRCFTTCPEGVFISHIGVMLSRNVPALRVNVKRLQADSLIPYLQQIGWEGETKELAGRVDELFGMCDRITVCLDVGNKIYPQIGLECIWLKQPQDEPRWRVFLDFLVAQGLCMPEKAEALLNWPGQTNPINSPAPWPDDLIVDSLLKPREQFTMFQRKLSHIKIVLHPHKGREAKAYLWFEHQWFYHFK